MTVTLTGPFGIAVFSEERPSPLYRYLLEPKIESNPNGPVVLFGMCNPSKASHLRSDNTVTRCIGFAEKLKARKLIVVNMCALISTDPDLLYQAKDPAGPENPKWIMEAIAEADILIVGWGALTKKQRLFFQPSIDVFYDASREKGLHCLGATKTGDPRHPLYLAANTELVSWPF